MKLEEPYNLIRTAESGLKAKMWSNEWRKIDREKRVREKCPKGKHGESKKSEQSECGSECKLAPWEREKIKGIYSGANLPAQFRLDCGRQTVL